MSWRRRDICTKSSRTGTGFERGKRSKNPPWDQALKQTIAQIYLRDSEEGRICKDWLALLRTVGLRVSERPQTSHVDRKVSRKGSPAPQVPAGWLESRPNIDRRLGIKEGRTVTRSSFGLPSGRNFRSRSPGAPRKGAGPRRNVTAVWSSPS